jgi:hypothetical protein
MKFTYVALSLFGLIPSFTLSGMECRKPVDEFELVLEGKKDFNLKATCTELDRKALEAALELTEFTQYSDVYVAYKKSGITVYMNKDEVGIGFNPRHNANPAHKNDQNGLEKLLSNKAATTCFGDQNTRNHLESLHTEASRLLNALGLKNLFLILEKHYDGPIAEKQTITSEPQTFACQEYTKTSLTKSTIEWKKAYYRNKSVNQLNNEITLKIETATTEIQK